MKPLYVKKNGVVYKISGNGIPALYPAENVEYDNTVTSELQATDVQGAIDELSTSLGTAYDHATETKLSTATASGLYKVAATAQGHISSLTAVEKSDITALGIPAQDTIIKNTAYGTCDTAGDVKDKVATLVNATNWSLEVGTIVGVRFTYTNTCSLSGISLNVNNTGAKNIRYSDGILTSGTDPKCPTAFGEAGQTIYYMYDGTYWVWVSHSKDNDTTYAFEGNTFRSEDGSNYYHGDGTNGNANNMTTNGHYYYNSNGPSTDIGAYGNDGAMFVQAYDSDNVAQIAQNYENGNLFVRSKANGSWTDWKKPIANITANNTVLTTDKTPFLTRQTLNPTGFSGYVREKLVGASYAWNQQVRELSSTYWKVYNSSYASVSFSDNVATVTILQSITINYYNAGISLINGVSILTGHKYLYTYAIKSSVNAVFGNEILYGSPQDTKQFTANVWGYVTVIGEGNSSKTGTAFLLRPNSNLSSGDTYQVKLVQLIDLTLAFGSTIADYLYSLANNGGITKLRDMGCPIDKYTAYGYGLYSVKTSGKKIVGKNRLKCDSYSSETWNGVKFTNNGDGTITANGTASANTFFPVESDWTSYGLLKDHNINQDMIVTGCPSGGSGASYGLYFRSGNSANRADVGSGVTIYYSDVVTYYPCIFIAQGYTANNLVFKPMMRFATISDNTFEPYSSTTYPLGNDELRGKFDLVNGEIVASGDVKESNGNVNRTWDEVDLGNVTWYKVVDGSYTYFRSDDISGMASEPYTSGKLVCAKYTTMPVTVANMGDKTIRYFNNQAKVIIIDSAYTDATTLKTSLSGVKLVFVKATPTTEQSTPFADPMSLVGATTEEYIDTRDVPCPVGAERQYMGQSDDVIPIPSSPMSDGKRVLFAQTSGNETQYYFDTPTLYYKEYVVHGDGTKTYGDLLAELKPYYLALSEDEKTYSKVMMRANATGNECLAFVGNYWYSRMGVNAIGLWIDQIDFQNIKYYRGTNGQAAEDLTNTSAGNYTIALRVLTYTLPES